VYVANWNDATVSPVDAITHTVGAAIGPAGLSPANVAVTPDGATAFVADFGNSRVTPIDTATNTALPFIDLGFPNVIPTNLAITPDGSTVFVTATDTGSGVLVPIDVATRTTGTAIPIGGEPTAVAITPDGSTAFVTDNGGNRVVPVDLATRRLGRYVDHDRVHRADGESTRRTERGGLGIRGDRSRGPTPLHRLTATSTNSATSTTEPSPIG
jgi:DNA-binding beta-propeller fold protein YncE